MPDLGTKLSDERTRKLMKRLENVYADAYKTAVANNEKALIKFGSFKDSDFPNLTSAEIKLKREAYIREVSRTKAVQKNIAAEIANAGNTAAKIIQGELTSIFGLNFDFAAFDIQRQAGLNLSFSQYDRNQIAVLISEKQSPFSKIAYKRLGQDRKIVQRLQDQFVQGIMNGESSQKLVRRVKEVTGQSTRQAKKVVRTERTRVASQGRNMAISEAVEMGIKMNQQWIARMVNTRDTHAAINGSIVKYGEKFANGLAFPGDPSGGAEEVINCYCVLKPMIESVSPALARHRKKFGYKSFEEYRELTGGDIITAQTDIDYYKGQVSRLKYNRDIATSEGRFENAEYHKRELTKAQSKLSSAKKHLEQATKNHERAIEREKK